VIETFLRSDEVLIGSGEIRRECLTCDMEDRSLPALSVGIDRVHYGGDLIDRWAEGESLQLDAGRR
jgi:hypothetical protein